MDYGDFWTADGTRKDYNDYELTANDQIQVMKEILTRQRMRASEKNAQKSRSQSHMKLLVITTS